MYRIIYCLSKRQSLRNDLLGILRRRAHLDALQLRFHQRLSHIIMPFPIIEGVREPRCNLRIALVNVDDLISDKLVACSVLLVKSAWIGPSKSVDKSAHHIRVVGIESFVPHQRLHILNARDVHNLLAPRDLAEAA